MIVPPIRLVDGVNVPVLLGLGAGDIVTIALVGDGTVDVVGAVGKNTSKKLFIGGLTGVIIVPASSSAVTNVIGSSCNCSHT